jgi:hypothetical protein
MDPLNRFLREETPTPPKKKIKFRPTLPPFLPSSQSQNKTASLESGSHNVAKKKVKSPLQLSPFASSISSFWGTRVCAGFAFRKQKLSRGERKLRRQTHKKKKGQRKQERTKRDEVFPKENRKRSPNPKFQLFYNQVAVLYCER